MTYRWMGRVAHGARVKDDERGRSSGPHHATKAGLPGLTYEQLRSQAFTATSRGVRLPASVADNPHARWAAALLLLPPQSVLSHTSAAAALNLPVPWRLQNSPQIHVSTPRDVPRPRRRDITTHHTDLTQAERGWLGGLRVTCPARTYVYMAALLGHADLVALGDVVLRDHQASHDELREVALRRGRYPGRGRALGAIDWLDPGAESPRESHLRVLLRQARLPHPDVNGVIVSAAGLFLARGDLVFRRERVIVEYDGEVHAPMEQRAKDAARRARLREHGWIVVEVVGSDMHHPARVIARVRSALRDGAARALLRQQVGLQRPPDPTY